MRFALALLAVLTLLASSCGPGAQCGPGTTLVGAECVAVGAVLCGSGTAYDGSQCVAVALSCGAGTVQQGTQCVPSGSAVTCGAGTVLQGAQCVPSGSAVTCGSGTTLSGTQCVAVGNGSGAYVLRTAVSTVPADGYSKIPVFAMGTLGSGAAATDAVVVTVNPSYAGTVAPSAFTLDAMGNTLYFTPCSSSSPACTGTFSIDLALASAPSVVVASTGALTLAAPTGVGSAAACAGTANVVFYSGDSGDYIFPGTATITQGTWSVSAAARSITVHVTPSNSSQGLWWDLEFTTLQLNQDLAVNVYQQAERAPFASPGHPGIDIGGDGRGCNTITGAFQVESLTWQGATLKNFTASFEQHCEGGTPALRGCVHFQQ